MVDKLAELGMPVNFEDVLAKADGSVGRPHLAEVMVEKGYVDSKFEAFEKWIGDGLPAHIAQPKPTISEAVAMVKQCGGVTSLAHPLYYGIPPQELANYCLDVGIDSIEAFHRSHSDGYRFELWDTCRELGLQVSCGSDFHGQTYGQNPGRCPYQKQTYVFEKFNNLSSINAISNKTTTGIATRNNDTGSGGDKNAPRTNAANQICFRYCLIWLGEVRP